MSNSAVVGTLRALLVADTAEFDRAMGRAGESAKTLAKGLKAVGKDATAVGQTLTASLTLPLVAIGGAAVKLASDFESSFAGVRKTVNATEAEFKALETQFRTLSKTIPVNVNELNKLGEAAGALGIPKEAIKGFVEVMAGLGVATDLTADQAANAIARIQNIFGAAGKDTDRFASTLVALGNAGASTEKEIVEMAQRIAGAGHTVGLTQAQVLAFASTLASVGINAEAGGSAISRVFLKINAAVGEGGKELAKFASAAKMSTADFKRAFETDAAGAVQKLISEIGKLGRDAGPVIQELLGKNIILTDTILRVAGAGELLTDQLNLANKAWQDNTALTEETAKRYETFASQVTILWNKLQDIGITLGQALLPVMRDLVALFDGFLPLLEGAVKWFSDLPGPVKTLAIVLAGVAAAAGPLLILFGAMATGLGTLMTSFAAGGVAATAFGAVLAFLSANPIVLLIAGLAALGIAIYSVATAETDLERELKATGKAFHQQTAELDIALAAYEDLSRKQHLTTEESKELDRVTRLLAEASGLSVEMFRHEASESDEVTAAIRRQILARDDLRREEIRQAGAKKTQLETELATLEQRLADVINKRPIVERQAGDLVAGLATPLGDAERLAASKTLATQIGTLTGQVTAATVAYHALSGVTDRQAAIDRETAAALPPLTAATQTHTRATTDSADASDKAAKAAEKHAEALAKAGRAISVFGINDKIAEMTARVKEANKHGGLAAEVLEDYAKQLQKWFMAGFELPPLLADLRLKHLALSGAMLSVTDNTKTLLGWTRQLTIAQLEGKHSTAGLADELKSFDKIIATSPLGGGMARTLGITLPVAKTMLTFEELAAAQIKAGEEALKRAQAWAESFGRILSGVWDDVSAGLTEMFAQGLSGAVSFADAFENVWKGLEQKLANVFRDILNLFINGLLRGMLGYLAGNQQAFSQAFGGLAGRAGQSLLGTALGLGGTAAMGGTVAAGGAAVGPTVGAAAATGAGVGGASAAGIAGAALGGAAVGGAVGYYVGYKSGSVGRGALSGAGAGAGAGAAIGSVVPGIGTAVGAGVGGIVGGLAGWYGAVKAGKEVNKLRDAFAASQGSMEAIEQRLIALGRHDLWAPLAHGERNVGAIKEAIGNVQEIFFATDRVLKSVADNFGKLTQAAAKYGTVLPKALRDTITPMLDLKDLTKEQRDELAGLAADPSWRTLQGIAEKYGIALSGLGAKFQKARITDIALEYARDWQVLIDSGADLTAVVEGAADELNALYKDAKDNGVALPETLRPYMQKLIDLGLLVDDDGEKIEDLNGITFEDIEDALLTQVVDVLNEIRDLLERQLPEAAQNAADGINDAFSRIRPPDVTPTGNVVPRPPPGPTGDESRTPPPGDGLQGGTHGQYVDWGSGTNVTLHGKERVATEGEAFGGAGATYITVISQLDGREVARNQVRHLPRTLQLAGL